MSGRTRQLAKPNEQASGRTKRVPESESASSGRTKFAAASKPISPPSGPDPYSWLLLFGDALNDAEANRIANENRLRSLVSGEEWGKQVSPDAIESRIFAESVEQLRVIEHRYELQIKRVFRITPLADWQKRTIGIGEKQLARLLGVIGNPADRANVAKLWAYCGHGDPARRRRRGMTQDDAKALGNPEAKMRTYLVAESCMKQMASPYRPQYEARRAKTAVDHPDWTPGHSHADALRIVGKAILRDMWIEACAARTNPGSISEGIPSVSAQKATA